MATVAVIVLGDLGRSPRMQYHAYSLSRLDNIKEVLLIGYKGEECIKDVKETNKIKEVRLSIPDLYIPFLNNISIIRIFYKGIMLLFTLIIALLQQQKQSKIDLIMIQNPPCIPAAIASIILSYFYSTKILLDWHNLSFKMYDHKTINHPNNNSTATNLLIQITKLIEFLISHLCHQHICVSNAMQIWLQEVFYIHPIIVYDRPFSTIFNPYLGTNLVVKHDLLLKYKLTDNELFPHIIHNNEKRQQVSSKLSRNLAEIKAFSERTGIDIKSSDVTTCQTILKYNKNSNDCHVYLRQDATHILISSTSWTPDEDFSPLLTALTSINQRLKRMHQKSVSTTEVPTRTLKSRVPPRMPSKDEFDPTSSSTTTTAATAGAVSSSVYYNTSGRADISGTTVVNNEVPGAVDDDDEEGVSLDYPKRILLIVTGKGPLKAAFEREVEGLRSAGRLDYVAVKCMWVEPEGEFCVDMSHRYFVRALTHVPVLFLCNTVLSVYDSYDLTHVYLTIYACMHTEYPVIMASADLGISMHTSTSGIDLPMKVSIHVYVYTLTID